jgi:hypothetical protein
MFLILNIKTVTFVSSFRIDYLKLTLHKHKLGIGVTLGQSVVKKNNYDVLAALVNLRKANCISHISL